MKETASQERIRTGMAGLRAMPARSLGFSNIVKGDLVFTSGSMGQTKWEKDGETFYGVTLAAERLERLCKGPNHHDNSPDEPQEQRRTPGADSDDIPF
jgi:single-strand DNA-binding protein